MKATIKTGLIVGEKIRVKLLKPIGGQTYDTIGIIPKMKDYEGTTHKFVKSELHDECFFIEDCSLIVWHPSWLLESDTHFIQKKPRHSLNFRTL